jgi:peptidoglycan/LPS O-acetylase OafA/YrhL
VWAMSRIQELDGLRALAAFLVIAWHFIGIPDGPDYWLWSVFYLGHFGVDLFFVLSGFLITTILLENRESPSYFSSFYGRRAFRIWPLYYLMCAICLLGCLSGRSPALFGGVLPGWTYILGIQNFWMAKLQNYGAFWLAGTWSLAIEEQFYLVFPLVVRFVPTAILPKLLWAIIVICPLGRRIDTFTGDGFGYYVLPQFRADVLAMGALIAWWRFSGRQSERVFRSVRIALLASAAMLPMICIAGSGTFHAAAWQHTLASVFFGAVVFTVLDNQGSSRLSSLRSGPARHFANWSYASYMIHHWVAYLMFAALGVTRTLTTLAGISTTAICFVLTFGLCAVSYRLFELPLNRYAHGRFFFRGRTMSPATAPAE